MTRSVPSHFRFLVSAFVQGTVALANAGNVTVSGWSASNYEHNLRLWNTMVERMWRECVLLGVAAADAERASSPAASSSPRCLPVPYELLVREPELWIRRVLAFLGLRFHPSVLQHPEHIASGAIRLSACASLAFTYVETYSSTGEMTSVARCSHERSSSQVRRPVYREALARWHADFPPEVLARASAIAPMLRVLGYAESTASDDTAARYSDLEHNFYVSLCAVYGVLFESNVILRGCSLIVGTASSLYTFRNFINLRY